MNKLGNRPIISGILCSLVINTFVVTVTYIGSCRFVCSSLLLGVHLVRCAVLVFVWLQQSLRLYEPSRLQFIRRAHGESALLSDYKTLCVHNRSVFCSENEYKYHSI